MTTDTLSPDTIEVVPDGPAPAGAAAQTSDPARSVPTRRISFDEALAGLPKHFAADGDLIMSHVMAGLSALFPDGEDFFVRSVRHFRDQITDPELRRQVNGFIGQESVHGREHRAFNDHLARLGYPTKEVERSVRRVLTTREKIMSPKSNLAMTAALEHFTATLAELVLRDTEFQQVAGDEAVRELFVWHALEEAEHKAVAFDVYRAVGGTERMRINTMRFVRWSFVVSTALQVAIAVLRDPASRERGRLRRSWKRFRRSPLVSREVWETLKQYEREGFHPDDIDTDDLVTTWREILFGAEGELNDKLSTAA